MEGRLPPDQNAIVSAHVADCDACAERIASSFFADEIPTDEGAEPIQDDHSEPIPAGTTMGRYIVVGVVGSGGLGEVYAAFDPELDRKVAIKVLRGSEATNQEVLMEEARAMAKLEHPNVVPVYDVGTTDGRVFLAMQLVRGETLRHWARLQKPTWSEVRDVMIQAGQALATAHAAGFVHRDFKPGNVMVGDDGRVMVMDFGIALAMKAAADTRAQEVPAVARVDGKSTVCGTPGYMAPEQYDSGAAVDTRADQFSFFVTLHESLYGHRPFVGRTTSALREAMRAGRVVDPPAGTHVPGWLRRVLLKGLSHDPHQRYPSMDACIDALQGDRRSRTRRIAGLAAAASLSALAVFGMTRMQQMTDEERRAVDGIVNESRAAAAKSYFVYPPPDQPDHATAYTKVRELEALAGGVEDLAHSRASELRGEYTTTLVRLGDSYWDREGGAPFAVDYYAAALIFDPSNDRAKERSYLTPGELATLRHKAETVTFSDSELAAAEPLIALAENDPAKRGQMLQRVAERRRTRSATSADRLERLVGRDVPPAAATPEVPADGPPPAVAVVVPQPEPTTEQSPPPQNPAPDPEVEAGETPTKPAPDGASPPRDTARAKSEISRGRAAFKAGRLDEAESHFHRALEADHRSAAARAGLAELHFERGQYGKAVQHGKRAASRRPKDGKLRLLLGDAYFKLARYPEARAAYERALELGQSGAKGRLERLKKKLAG